MRVVRALGLRWPVGTSVVLSALALGVLWTGGELARRAFPGHAFAGVVARLPVLAFVLCFLWAGRWWRGAGFRRPRAREIRHGWPLAMMVLYLLSLVAWRDQRAWLPSVAEHATVAIWEEILFRGVVLFLLARRGTKFALLGSAALFAGLHVHNLTAAEPFPSAAWKLVWPFGLGAALATLRVRTGSIWPPVAAHFLINAVDGMAPAPLTWSGWTPLDYPVELLLFFVLLLSCGLGAIERWRRAARLAGGLAAAGIVGLCAIGLLLLDGPRPGWDGPALDASVSVDAIRDGDAWRYSYRLTFRSEQAEIVSFGLRVYGKPEVRELRAVAGERTWGGTREGNWLVWKGGVAPVTTYCFRSDSGPEGGARFKVVYRDRHGSTREWKGRLDNAPLG